MATKNQVHIYINHIKRKLWSNREYGQAAVMIGAGFSRNADRIRPGTGSFALWNELSSSMFDELYSCDTMSPDEKKAAIAQKGALALASEYACMLGQEALDSLLKDQISDMDFEPGRIHETLLALPWSDVFTTNYDTLLERTLCKVYNNKYSIVVSQSDLPGKTKPRIVKLHGSFPSKRPFIITEEHYRTYPSEYAGFVNTVQQSIMENVFCLLGFSGNDPNFKLWAGWVRDNLGESRSDIYLCGWLNLSESQSCAMRKHRIIPVDLSQAISRKDLSDPDNPHKSATEWFLRQLHDGKPADPFTWPGLMKRKVNTATTESANLHLKKENIEEIPPPPFGRPFSEEELHVIIKVWERERKSYPGWVVAPKENRDSLWRRTENYLSVIFGYSALPAPYDLQLVYEWMWRYEKALAPLFIHWCDEISKLIKRYNPFPTLISLDSAEITPDQTEFTAFDWSNIKEFWIKLVFALAREAREDLDHGRFTFWMQLIKPVCKLKSQWESRWSYEECLYHLFCFNEKKLRVGLEEWVVDTNLAFWILKKSSLLAELGEIEAARELAEQALITIRSHTSIHADDYERMSQEGWAMLLLKGLHCDGFRINRALLAEYRNRWVVLERHRCNPEKEIQSLSDMLAAPIPAQLRVRQERISFDPGNSKSVHYSGSSDLEKFLPAFQLLRMLEEGAVPICAGGFGYYHEIVITAAKWIYPFAPKWSIVAAIRTGDTKICDEFYSRSRVAALSTDDMNYYVSTVVKNLNSVLENILANPSQLRIDKRSWNNRYFFVFTEIASRIAFRLSKTDLLGLLQLALLMYKHPIFRERVPLYDSVNTLIRRTLYALSDESIIELLPDLLQLPIAMDGEYTVAAPVFWIDPFNYIHWTHTSITVDRATMSVLKPIVQRLIHLVSIGSEEVRKRSALRLQKLLIISCLDEDDMLEFGKALWERLSEDTCLPAETLFRNSAFLHLPAPDKDIAKKHYKKYILGRTFPRSIQMTSFNGKDTKAARDLINTEYDTITECISGTYVSWIVRQSRPEYIDWSKAEAIEMLDNAEQWWNEEKEYLSDLEDLAGNDTGFPTMENTVRHNFLLIVELLGYVVIPRLLERDSKAIKCVKNLLSNMEKKKILTVSIIPIVMHIGMYDQKEVTKRIQEGIRSQEDEEVLAALKGISLWVAALHNGYLPDPSEDILEDIALRILMRRQPGLDHSISLMAVVAEKYSTILTKEQLKLLSLALESLQIDTVIMQHNFSVDPRKEVQGISQSEMPRYRELSAKLAYSLVIAYKTKGLAIPTQMDEWRKICEESMLPEVRRIWEKWSILN